MLVETSSRRWRFIVKLEDCDAVGMNLVENDMDGLLRVTVKDGEINLQRGAAMLRDIKSKDTELAGALVKAAQFGTA
jgi:hypothetical protein